MDRDQIYVDKQHTEDGPPVAATREDPSGWADTHPAAPAPASAGDVDVDDRGATASAKTSILLNAGGDPKTTRVLDTDDEGNVTGSRVGRLVVIEGGLVVFREIAPASAEERNAEELAALERRIDELRREG